MTFSAPTGPGLYPRPRRIDADAGGELSGQWDTDDEAAMIDRVEQRVEDLAPGFRASIIGRHIFTPGLSNRPTPIFMAGPSTAARSNCTSSWSYAGPGGSATPASL
jgi:phytoene dehydrogenase-like protein